MNYLSKLSVEQEELLGVDITPGAVRVVQLSEKDDKWTVNKLGYKFLKNTQMGILYPVERRYIFCYYFV